MQLQLNSTIPFACPWWKIFEVSMMLCHQCSYALFASCFCWNEWALRPRHTKQKITEKRKIRIKWAKQTKQTEKWLLLLWYALYFIQQNLNSCMLCKVQILFVPFWRFAMVRISGNGPSWLRIIFLLVNHSFYQKKFINKKLLFVAAAHRLS